MQVTQVASLLLLLACFGFVGNIFIISTIIKQKIAQKKRFYYLVLSLAIADGIGSLIEVLCWIGVTINKPVLGDPSVPASGYTWSVWIHCYWMDVLTLVSITLIQAIAIKRIGWLETKLNPKVITALVITTWATPLLFSIPSTPALNFSTSMMNYTTGIWTYDPTQPGAAPMFMAGFALRIVTMPILVICSLYILFQVRKARASVANQSQQRQEAASAEMRAVAVQFCIVNAVYSVDVVLYFVTLLGGLVNIVDLTLLWRFTSLLLFGCNLYVYIACNKAFRAEFQALMRWILRRKPAPATELFTASHSRSHRQHRSIDRRSRNQNTSTL